MSRRCLHILVLAVAVILSVLLTKRCQNEGNGPSTVVIHDTITNMVWDTSYVTHTVTVMLPTTDTIWKDSVRIDSVVVEVPISRYIYDTLLTTDTTELGLRLSVSGYAVSLDTLACLFHYTPNATIPKERRFGVFVGPMIGVSSDRRLSVGVGIGFGMKLFPLKTSHL